MSDRSSSVRGWASLLLAVAVLSGCTARGVSSPETNETGVQDPFRVRVDAVRARQWELGLDDVRVYDDTTKTLIRRVTLPNWSVARFVCDPDMVLDRSGSVIISGNLPARLWRIDADSFEVKQHEISLQGKEQWDIGFGALAFTANGTLLALTSSANSL